MDSQASSSGDEDDERNVSTVATDTDASSIFDMLHDDPQFDSLRLNSVVTSRVPDEVIAIDDLEEGEWTDDEGVEDKVYKNIQIEDFGNGNWSDSDCEPMRSSPRWRITSVHYE